MRSDERYKKHAKNVHRETNNPAILNDVIDNGLEQYPGHEVGHEARPRVPAQAIMKN